MPGHTYTGASKRHYPYLLVDSNHLDLLPMQGGNYIFASNDLYRSPIFVDASSDVRSAVLRNGMEFWKVARAIHGAALVLIHIDHRLDANDLETERRDLIEAYRPVMNPTRDSAP